MNPPESAATVAGGGGGERVKESTDYRAKRVEYSVLDISEYWICDPLKEMVTVGMLLEGWYEAVEHSGKGMIESPVFSNLELTGEKIL